MMILQFNQCMKILCCFGITLILKVLNVSCQTPYICRNDPLCVNHFYCGVSASGEDVCLCRGIFNDSEYSQCSWATGMNAVLEDVQVNTTYLFFNAPATWENARDYCEDIGGLLAVPNTIEIHNSLVFNMERSALYRDATAVWLGFSDRIIEGEWVFENAELVNLPPPFSTIDFTDGGTLPLPAENTTSIDERWHFFHDLGENYVDFNQSQLFCERFDANLSTITDQQEHERVIQRIDRYTNLFSARYPMPPYVHGIFYIGVERPASNIAGWGYLDGTAIYQDREWYFGYPTVPIPTDEQLAQFNGWAFPDEPNNEQLPIYSPNETELCGAYSYRAGGWIDFSCNQRVHTFCELGPYSFERWHLGGTIPDYSEPNNGGGVTAFDEDCGAMRLDIVEDLRFEFSSSVNEFWNDYECERDLPFACEININNLPANCSTYNPPLSSECIETIRRNTSCNGDISEEHRRNYLSTLSIIALRNHFRISVELARNSLDGLFFEACNGSDYLPYSESTELKFVVERMTYGAAQAYCRLESATLVTIDSARVNSWILRKIVGWEAATGTNSFYIGLNDVQMEGIYRWQDDTFLNIASDYQNWSPFVGFVQSKDCVVITAFEQWRWSQADCGETHPFICMRLLPDSCSSQAGPHSIDCLLSAWREQCFQEGLEEPTTALLASLQNIRLSEYRRQNELLREQAVMGNRTAQLDCFGFDYSRNCSSFTPPLSLTCLLELYLNTECTEDGAYYPADLQTSNPPVYDDHRNFNVRDYSSFILDVQSQANQGVVQHQINCYGIAFPTGCTNYIGFYVESCIQSIFLSVGCVVQGSLYPTGLTPTQLAAYNGSSILQIQDTFRPTKANAENGNTTAQQECYGLTLSGNCTSYDAVLSRECLYELWISAGCTNEGAGNPLTLSPRKYMEWYGTKNYRQASNLTILTQLYATTFARGYDELCYGTGYHQYNCSTYAPPHSLSCLLNIWTSVGCIESGTMSPSNNITSIYQTNISDTISLIMQFRANVTTSTNTTASQLQCYGRSFPANCSTYRPPFSLECLISIWTTAGCTLTGTQSPSRLLNPVYLQNYGNPTSTLSSIEASVGMLYQRANASGNPQAELDCFGTAIPSNCSFYPPLSMLCLDIIWMQGGCAATGTGFPTNLTVLTLPPMQRMTLVAYVDHVRDLYARATAGDAGAQMDCFGYGFLTACPVFAPPLPVECLNQIWLSFASCTMQGLGYPDILSSAQLDQMWGRRNQSAARSLMRDIKTRADMGDANAQLQCYGVELLAGCSYLPPYNDSCLDSLWTSIGCTDAGTAYPLALNASNGTTLYGSVRYPDLLPILENFRRDNLECLGFEIPQRCSLTPPRSFECLQDLFDEAGCNSTTGQIPPALVGTYRNLNFTEIREAFSLINESAVDPLNGVHAEVCFGVSSLSLSPNLTVSLQFQLATYNEAVRSCRSRNMLLIFGIANATQMQLYINKLQNASMFYGIDTWWLGLNDQATENTFVWESGVPLTGYTNWNMTPPPNSEDRDCVYMNASENFEWFVGDCSARHGFLCQEVNCVYTSTRSPIGIVPVEEQCTPPCTSHEICSNATCQCRPLFTGAACDAAAELFPVAEERHRGQNYLLFHEMSTWLRASDYCNLLNGTLAIPANQTIHDLIIRLVNRAQTSQRWIGLWLGFSDRATEGNWIFEDGTQVSLAPQFTGLTGTNVVPRHIFNTTSQDERWHFYWGEPNLLLNYSETTTFCSQISGGHLAIVYDKDENNRLYRNALRIARLARLRTLSIDSINFHVFLGLTRNETDLTSWTFTNGDRVFPPLRWYEEGKYAGMFPIPTREQLLQFQLWDFPNPDNLVVELFNYEPEMCAAVVEHPYQISAWWDVRCNDRYRPVCEIGPLPFERWRHGGTIDPVISEPNDGWCNEDCGGLRLDLSDQGRFEFTGILTEFWNDFNCNLELPYACQIGLPSECSTFSPPLSTQCIDYLRTVTSCDQGYLSPAMYSTLSQQSFQAVRNILTNFNILSANRTSGVYFEICQPFSYAETYHELAVPISAAQYLASTVTNQDNTPQVGGLGRYITRINETTYVEADAGCQGLNYTLLVLPSDDLLQDYIRQKIALSPNTSGVDLFWIGLTDRRAEGNYEWVTGEPLKSYQNWSPRYTPSDDDRDCVALNVSDGFRWIEANCNERHGFICFDPTDPCLYPTNYSVPYKDQCVYFQVDPANNRMSTYKRTLNEAIATCQRSNGQILPILDQNDASFLEFNGKEAFNLPFHHSTKFWVPLFDVAPSSRTDPRDRNWMWMIPGQSNMALGSFNTFVIDEFQISNLVQPQSRYPRLFHINSCLYGDTDNNTYRNPLGPYVRLDFVRSRACNDSIQGELEWIWVSTYHLMNIRAQLCLTAPIEHEETLLTALSPGIRVRPCNLTDPLQQWVCHSRNPLHLKLRAYRYSFIVDRVEPLDRAFVAGGLYGEDCYSLWRTLNNEYICDERYRPAESLFLLRRSGLRPPSLDTRSCAYSDRSTSMVFYGRQEAATACALNGGRIASTADITEATRAGFTEGCACAYLRDDDVLRGFLPFIDKSCQGIPGLPSNTQGLFRCVTTVSDYVWCLRGQRANNVVFGGVDFTPLCATYSFLSSTERGFESRSCNAPHYFACQKNTTGPFCTQPPTPPFSTYIEQDWRVSPMGQGATVRCDPGYGINGANTTLTATIMCQMVAAVLQWVPDPVSITCAPLLCPNLPAPVNATMVIIPPRPPGSFYVVGDSSTYTCMAGTSLNGLVGMTNFTTTCLLNSTWSPFPIPPCIVTRCFIPVINNAQAVYNSTIGFLIYTCNQGYWINRGTFDSGQYTCAANAQWMPTNPMDTVFCLMATCDNVTSSPTNGRAYFMSNRYDDRLIIQCDPGFSLVPRDLRIVCTTQGNWSRATDDDYCQDITCADPPPQPADVLRTVIVKPEYVYGDMVQYTTNRRDLGILNVFMILTSGMTQCLTSSAATGAITLGSTCEEDSLEMNWIWIDSFQIVSLANPQTCLTVVGGTLSLTRCQSPPTVSMRQQFDCPLVSSSGRNTFALRDGSRFISIDTATNTLNINTAFTTEWYARDISKVQRSICEMRGYFLELNFKRGACPYLFPTKYLVTKYFVTHHIVSRKVDLDGVLEKFDTSFSLFAERDHEDWLLAPFSVTPQRSVVGICGRDGQWFPPLAFLAQTAVTCPPLLNILNANITVATSASFPYTATVGTTVNYQCFPGFWFGPGALSWTLTCNLSGEWLPRLDLLQCMTLTCPAPYDVLNAVYIGFDWRFNSTVNYTCNLGYWFGRNEFTRITTCDGAGVWSPDPMQNFQCIAFYVLHERHRALVITAVTCLDPGPRPNMTYSILGTEVNYNSIVEYFCNANFYFSAQRFTSVGVVCTADGTYSPRVTSLQCQRAICPIPFPINNARFSFASQPSYAGSVMSVDCLLGYRTSTGVFSVNVTCGRFGQWQPDPYMISCQAIFCLEPYVIPNAVLTGRGFQALSVRQVTCNFGYFINQRANIRVTRIMCGPRNATWVPANIRCLRAECAPPAPVLNSFPFQSLSSYYVGDTAVFRCLQGYETPSGSFEFSTTCRINSSFIPDLSSVVCQRRSCVLPSITFSNGVLTAAAMPIVTMTTYFYEDVVTLTCNDSFWVFIDRGRISIDFVCARTGYFEPNPQLISCTAVQCPMPPPRVHSTLSVASLSVNSIATYRCAVGFGMMTSSGLQTTWQLTCRVNGEWRDSPSAVMCRMVDCGEPPDVRFATRIGSAYTFSETVTYMCFMGRWFDRGVFERSITCSFNRTWTPSLPECSIVSCFDPSSMARNAAVLGRNFFHRSMVTVVCNIGYYISPTVNHVLVRCLSRGVWDYPIHNQTCIPVKCPYPPVVWYASTTGTNYSLNAVVTYTCNANYMISLQRGINATSITCTETGLWQPDPSFIVCLQRTQFVCPVPPSVANARLSASSFAVGSAATVTCLNGFWISPRVYFTQIRCTMARTWTPDPPRIVCRPIRCRRLTPSANATFLTSSTSYNGQVTIACASRYSIVTNFTGMFRMTSMSSVILVCGRNGQWQPEANQVACRLVSCPVPVLDSTIFSTSPIRDVGVGATYQLSCLPGSFIAPGQTSASITCLQTGVWAPDLTGLRCRQIQCGVTFIPAHGSYSGTSTGYRASIRFQCDDGYQMPFVNERLELIERTYIDLVCGINGIFMGVGGLIDCEIITCTDPGYHVAATREPSVILDRHPLGTEVTYTCQNNTWFYRYVRSLSYNCRADGLWYRGGSTVVPPCRSIACWPPPSIFNSVISSSAVSQEYEFRDNVIFRCMVGYKFNVEPACRCAYYTITCLDSGLWTTLPNVLACEAVTCDAAPHIDHSTLLLRARALLPGTTARYRCDNGFSAVRMGVASTQTSNEFALECSTDGSWIPDASTYTCQVLRCPDPPLSIPNGFKQGRVYETGFHVTYVCRKGYTVRGNSYFQGMSFVTIICGFNAAWNTDVTQLACREIECGNPPVILGASVAQTGASYLARARYQCTEGFFIKNNEINALNITCNASGRWEPAPNTINCRPYVCSDPNVVGNANIRGVSFSLRSTIVYECVEGFILNTRNTSFRNQSVMASSVCLYPQSWSPPLSSLACLPVRCSEPERPPRTYVNSGAWLQNGTASYRFGDVITLTCAVGYYFNGTNRSIALNATCQADGMWSNDFLNFECVEVRCRDPGYKLFAFRGAITLQYGARVRYTCLRGFAVRPGLTERVLECSFQATWTPSLDFECLVANCGEPPDLNFTTKEYQPPTPFNGIGGVVRYTTVMDGYIISAERDATGEWYSGNVESDSITVTCQPNGRWFPSLKDVRVLEPTSGVTLFQLVPDGQLIDLFSYSPFRAPSQLSNRINLLLNEMEVAQLNEQTELFDGDEDQDEPQKDTTLFVNCEEKQVFVIHHFGRWLQLPGGSVETQHIPVWLSESGLEARVENMFDDDPDTFWMPVDAPRRDEVATNWPGWEVVIDLGRKHVVGSFRLHSSRNYVNDVETFYVLVSSNKELWMPLGPFFPLTSTEGTRKEFFYNFDPVETRYVRLKIISTFLYRAPIITQFGVFGSTFDCVDRMEYTADLYLVPLFIFVLLLIFIWRIIASIANEKKKRWKRYLLKSPSRFKEDRSNPERIYELNFTTAINTSNADVLLKIYGSKAISPILWLRSNFNGSLRSGFTDSHAVQVPRYLGKLQRVDVMCAYTSSKDDPFNQKNNQRSNLSKSDKSLSDVFSAASSVGSTFKNDTRLLHKPSRASLVNFVSRRYKKPIFSIADITVADPGTGEKWAALLPLDVDSTVSTSIKDWWMGKKGVYMPHGHPKCFLFHPVRKISGVNLLMNFSIYTLCSKLSQWIRLFYREHYLFNCSRNFLSNLTYVETYLVGFTGIFTSLLVSALYQGFSNRAFYFLTRLSQGSSVIRYILSTIPQYSVLVTFLISFFLVFILGLSLRILAGNWERRVEQKLSYWQGTKTIGTCFFLAKCALQELGHSGYLSCFPVTSQLSDADTESSSDDYFESEDDSYHLANNFKEKLRSTYQSFSSCDEDIFHDTQAHLQYYPRQGITTAADGRSLQKSLHEALSQISGFSISKKEFLQTSMAGKRYPEFKTHFSLETESIKDARSHQKKDQVPEDTDLSSLSLSTTPKLPSIALSYDFLGLEERARVAKIDEQQKHSLEKHAKSASNNLTPANSKSNAELNCIATFSEKKQTPIPTLNVAYSLPARLKFVHSSMISSFVSKSLNYLSSISKRFLEKYSLKSSKQISKVNLNVSTPGQNALKSAGKGSRTDVQNRDFRKNELFFTARERRRDESNQEATLTPIYVSSFFNKLENVSAHSLISKRAQTLFVSGKRNSTIISDSSLQTETSRNELATFEQSNERANASLSKFLLEVENYDMDTDNSSITSYSGNLSHLNMVDRDVGLYNSEDTPPRRNLSFITLSSLGNDVSKPSFPFPSGRIACSRANQTNKPKSRRRDVAYESCKKFDIILHVITYRSHPPKTLEKKPYRPLPPPVEGQKIESPPSNYPGVALRFLICVFCLLLILFSAGYIIANGFFSTTDGTSYDLLKSFLFNIAVMLFLVIPVTGWLVYFAYAIKSKKKRV